MRGEIEGDFDSGALARLYFLGFIDAADRHDILIRIRDRALADLKRLNMVEREVAKTQSNIPDDLRDVAVYQKATLDSTAGGGGGGRRVRSPARLAVRFVTLLAVCGVDVDLTRGVDRVGVH